MGGTRIHDAVVIGAGFNGQSILSDAIGRSCNPPVPEAGSKSSLRSVKATSKPHSSMIAG